MTSILKISDTLDLLPAQAHSKMTDRYMFIDSREVVGNMLDLGFHVNSVKMPKYRGDEYFGMHEIDFRRKEDLNRKDGEIPRIIFQNSYDGTRKAQIITGIFRFVCSNGMTVGTTVEKQKFLHVGNYADELIKAISDSSKLTARMFERIEQFRQVRLEQPELKEMASRALELRFPLDKAGKQTVALDPMLLLQPRRKADVEQDLWTQFNVLQENLVKGGVPVKDAGGHDRLTSPVTQILRNTQLNQNLWDLVEQYGPELTEEQEAAEAEAMEEATA